MKSLIFALSIVGITSAIPVDAYSLAVDCCGAQSGTHDNSCTTKISSIGDAGSSTTGCCAQSGTITSTSNGVISTYTCNQQYTKTGSIVSTTCVCSTKTYKCASGYYGTATSATTGCTKCPNNATCDGTTDIVCNKDYYRTGSTGNYACTKCPSPGMNGGPGATSIKWCFLAPNNGTTYYDAVGRWTISENCYYSETQTPQYPVLGGGS